jgi:hypothetical protein
MRIAQRGPKRVDERREPHGIAAGFGVHHNVTPGRGSQDDA